MDTEPSLVDKARIAFNIMYEAIEVAVGKGCYNLENCRKIYDAVMVMRDFLTTGDGKHPQAMAE